LLIQEDGDVARALEILNAIGTRYGLFDEDLTFEDFKDRILSDRLISAGPSGFSLTPKGERFVRLDSLDQIFSHLKRGDFGAHPSLSSGPCGERLAETRSYRFGDDPSEIDFVSSYRNASCRIPREGLNLREEDLRVFETEQHVSVATALLVDVSHSMVLYGEDRITPAKQVALALVELILTRFPKDTLRVVAFGDEAREIAIRDIPYLQVGPFHTNTRAGLELAQGMLEGSRQANRQVFMITDGKPTAIIEDGEVYRNPWGFDPKIRNQTLEAAAACRRAGITITTFMLASDPDLVDFVEEMTRIARGRAYFASADRLGEFLFADYIRNKRRTLS
jgi:uncharacterized protein with von Willebrand factor type A (vWA) domain